jgi:hypothetical protein
MVVSISSFDEFECQRECIMEGREAWSGKKVNNSKSTASRNLLRLNSKREKKVCQSNCPV